MSEFIILIKTTGNPIGSLPKEEQEKHIKKVGSFIQDLVTKGKMKNAQPLIPYGILLSNADKNFKTESIDENKEMIVGFYQILAANMEEAVNIAKTDPRFKDGTWRMEIREIMNVEGIN
jgi:hypothetical protein